MKYIVQEAPMGCGIASVANLLQISYKKASILFKRPNNHIEKGFSCKDIVYALKKGGLDYDFKKIDYKTKHLLKNNKIIVFVKEGKDDLYGHYLLKVDNVWIDPWINWPLISPAKAGIHNRLIGKPLWIIYPKELFFR